MILNLTPREKYGNCVAILTVIDEVSALIVSGQLKSVSGVHSYLAKAKEVFQREANLNESLIIADASGLPPAPPSDTLPVTSSSEVPVEGGEQIARTEGSSIV